MGEAYHDAGFQQIKIYSSVKLEQVKAVAAAAHAAGMTVTGHIPEGVDLYDAVNAGMDQINHIDYLMTPLRPKDLDWAKATRAERMKAQAAMDVHSPEAERLIAFLKDHGTVIDDTAALDELLLRPAGDANVRCRRRVCPSGAGIARDVIRWRARRYRGFGQRLDAAASQPDRGAASRRRVSGRRDRSGGAGIFRVSRDRALC